MIPKMMAVLAAAAVMMVGTAGAVERIAPSCDTSHVAAYVERHELACETHANGFVLSARPPMADPDAAPGVQ